jgi:ribokinase
MAKVCVVGSVNLDLTLAVDNLPRPGETVLASSLSHTPGGKGGNQAVAAARAGAQVHFVGAVVVAPGANGRLTLDPPPAVVTDCDVLLTQLEIPVPAATAAARAARSAGAVVIVNASPAGQDQGLLEELATVADVVVVNEEEAAQWPWRPTHLVVTLGARGARYVGADGEYTVPAPKVRAVDTTGAGDVFAGVLAANWPTGDGSADGRRRALRHGCAAGALATLTPGAGNCAPDAAAIDAALRERFC